MGGSRKKVAIAVGVRSPSKIDCSPANFRKLFREEFV